MPLSEFNLIQRYFTPLTPAREDVIHGVGDDGAVLHVPIGMDLVASVDTLVSGVHFFPDVDPVALGYKALAVNLSDMAAMGAEPAWATLALTLPLIDEAWLAAFSRGFFELAEHYGVQLVGGDTCRGPLTVSVQMHGFIPQGAALRRAGAMPGDLIYVTGTLGDAGLALQALRQQQALVASGIRPPGMAEVSKMQEHFFDLPLATLVHPCTAPTPHARYLQDRLERPSPRVFEGLALRGIASAAIDISDGLAADLGHILAASGMGATLEIERLPVSPAFVAAVQEAALDADQYWQLPLSAGDDYELCFTVPAEKQAKTEQVFARFGCGATRIGTIESQPGLRCKLASGEMLTPASSGYQHFT